MTELRQLALYNNDHTGEIPVTIYDNLLHLVYLNLQDNRLTGQLRPEVGQLSSLKKLILFNNELEGPVHSLHIANIDELEYLGLSGNKFSGSIAHQIGNIPSLEYLYLDNNRFTGTLPTKLGLLSSLSKYLFLRGFIRCERMYLCDYLNTPVQYK
jgi:Leucine-rich repeat (LRR) protein